MAIATATPSTGTAKRMIIDGKWENGAANKSIGVINPATEEVICEMAFGSRADTKRALEAAARAMPAWMKLTPFDRAKVVAGVQAAAKNRPVSMVQMEALASEVEEQVRMEGPEVATQQIGRAVLDRLRELDEVAYLRFASVYKGFTAAGDFEREAGLLTKETEPKRR